MSAEERFPARLRLDGADEYVREALQLTALRNDRLFTYLTCAEWIACVVFAIWIAPLTWSGGASSLNPHIYFAVIIGGIVAALPIASGLLMPGSPVTRYAIAVSQMIMAGLLVHLSGGRIETHFLYFGLLALLAFYRDWQVLVLAAGVAALDHFVRGLWFPHSIYGVLTATTWRTVEHAAYVVFEVTFLVDLQRQSLNEIVARATRQRDAEGVAERLRLQNEVSQFLMSWGAPDQVMLSALKAMANGMGYGWTGVWRSVGSATFQLETSWCEPGEQMTAFQNESRQIVLAGHAGPLARVVASGSPLWLADYSQISVARAASAERADLRSWIGVPVSDSSGVIAVWEFFLSTDVEPTPARYEFLAVMARVLGSYFERRRDRQAISDSEGRYRFLFENNPMPMWVIDQDSFDFLAVNNEALRLYGYGEEEFLTMKGTDIRPPDDVAGFVEHVAKVRDSLLPTALKRRTQHKRRSGELLDVDVTQFPLDWKGHRGELAMVNDITERTRLEREREAMELQLRHAQKLEAIGQLAAGIAHEINTPGQYVGDNLRFLKDSFVGIEAVLSRSEALASAAEGSASDTASLTALAGEVRASQQEADIEYLRTEIPSAIDQALDGISQVSTIVAAMKEFSHPGRKEKAPADLRSAISNVIVVSRNEWKYSAEIETDFDAQLPPVPCIVGEINQVVLNLIVNAAHAIQDRASRDTAHAGEKGSITIRTRLGAEWAEIQVEDTGGGIPEHVRDRVFEPFFTTKEVGRGTGQGLAIARSVIVDKHGGSIDFVTRPGDGTTFFIRLPLEQSAQVATV